MARKIDAVPRYTHKPRPGFELPAADLAKLIQASIDEWVMRGQAS